MPSSESIHIVDQTIRARHTTKMLAAHPLPVTDASANFDDIIAAAGWAPFHRPCASVHRSAMDSIQPWRCYALEAASCRQLSQSLINAGDATKIPAMLAAAQVMIQVTWLPNPPKAPSNQLFEPTLENMEHLAAASAAVQNMLLAATARGFETYWSSGGSLREANVKQQLGIPEIEIPLGSIFLFPDEADGVETAPGKLREMRGPQSSWMRWVTLR